MKKIFLTLFFSLPLSLFANMWFSSLPYYTSARYEGNTLAIPLAIEVRNQGEPQDFFITLSGGQGGSPENRIVSTNNGASAPYQLYNSATEKIVIKDLLSMPGEENVLTGYVAGGRSTAYLEYVFYMEAGIYAPYGYLSDSYTVTLYSGTLDNYTLVTSNTVQMAITVDRQASISVVPRGGAYNESSTDLTMDFGFLTPRAERTADILVRANLPYTLSVRSNNGSVLKQVDQYTSSEIPYQFLVNDLAVTLQAGRSVDIGAADISSAQGDRYSLRFIIGDFWDIQSGTFEDTLQITLAAW